MIFFSNPDVVKVCLIFNRYSLTLQQVINWEKPLCIPKNTKYNLPGRCQLPSFFWYRANGFHPVHRLLFCFKREWLTHVSSVVSNPCFTSWILFKIIQRLLKKIVFPFVFDRYWTNAAPTFYIHNFPRFAGAYSSTSNLRLRLNSAVHLWMQTEN